MSIFVLFAYCCFWRQKGISGFFLLLGFLAFGTSGVLSFEEWELELDLGLHDSCDYDVLLLLLLLHSVSSLLCPRC